MPFAIPNMAGTLIFTKSVDRYRLRGTGCTVAKNYGFLHAVDGEEAVSGTGEPPPPESRPSGRSSRYIGGYWSDTRKHPHNL